MVNFVTKFKNDSAYLEILGEDDNLDYYVDFIDLNTNIVEYSTIIKVNHWSKLNDVSEKNITIRVTLNDNIVFERNKEYKFNRVYINIGSESLGDNIAWIPCVENYRKTHNVEVILRTAHNYLFDDVYTDIIFTSISDPDIINDVDKKFRIDLGPELYFLNGVLNSELWFETNKKYDNFVEYYDYRTKPLQSIANLILGLNSEEIVAKINIPDEGPKIKGKYVVVAIQSTAQLKYWNNPFGWERLFDFLGRNGYKVVVIDRYKSYGTPGHYNQAPKLKNVIDKTGNHPLSERIIDIKYADMMITISSGLAWIAWATGTPVVMISGFTKPWLEFQSNIIRVHNNTVCNGCWNDPKITFDGTDWLFCPKKQDFICSKIIQPREVIDAVKKLMK